MNANVWSAVVTGGGSGLGRASACELKRRGAEVVVADLDTEASRAGAAKARVSPVPADVRDEDQLAVAIATAAKAGPLRVLVTCAGVGTAGRVLGVSHHRRSPRCRIRFRTRPGWGTPTNMVSSSATSSTITC